jgi:hypothetical protein
MRPVSSVVKINSKFFLLLFVVALICNAGTISGQILKYDNLSFSEALAKAKKSNQLVFIHLESDCDQCNSMANEGLSGDEIGELFGKFVCIKVGFNTEDYKKVISDYRIFPNYPSSVFVDSDGNYLASMLNQSTNNRNIYFKLAANAMANEKNPPFKIYTVALSKEKFDKELLKQYIVKLYDKNFNIADLVEKYAETLTIKELSDTAELKFLIRTAPIVNSNLYKLIHLNSVLYNKVFESIPFEERVRINQKTILQSKEKAIREKDRKYLYSVSSFLTETYNNDYKAAQKANYNLQMEYYKAIKDSSQYYELVKQYYFWYIKSLKMDSVCNSELNLTISRPDGAIIKGGSLYKTGIQLNNMAFSLLQLSSDKEYLGYALKLSEQTLRYNYPPFIDTYAQILYKLGGKKDAIDWQQKAVDLSDSLHQPNSQLKEVLAKMKSSSL